MEVFNFIWIALLNEAERCNVFFSKKDIKATYVPDADFCVPQNRLAYLYKYGALNIMFMKECIMKFVFECPQALFVADKIRSTEKLRVCSLSLSPGTDIVGLLYAFINIGKPITKSVILGVINKCDSWQNLIMNMLYPSHNIVYPQPAGSIIGPLCGSFELVKDDIFSALSAKTRKYLRTADVVLMVKTFSSCRTEQIAKVLEEILQLLKPGALVFFIGNKKKSDIFVESSTCGNFLYGPTKVKIQGVPFIDKVSELIQSKPDQSANGYFAVWEKSSLSKINPMHSVDSASILCNKSLPSVTSQDTSVENSVLYKTCAQQVDFLKDNFTNDMENLKSVTVGTSGKTTTFCNFVEHKSLSLPDDKTSVLTSHKNGLPNDKNRSNSSSYNDVLQQVDSVISHLEKFVQINSSNSNECLKNVKQNHAENSCSSSHLSPSCGCISCNFCHNPHSSVQCCTDDCMENFCDHPPLSRMSNSCCCLKVRSCRNSVCCHDSTSKFGRCDCALSHSLRSSPYITIPISKISKENLNKISSLICGTGPECAIKGDK